MKSVEEEMAEQEEREFTESGIRELDRKINKVLFAESYRAIGLVYLKEKKVFFRATRLEEPVFTANKKLDYYDVVDQMAAGWIDENDREIFNRAASLENLEDRLEQSDRYFFSVCNCLHEIERYTYLWLDHERHILLFVIEDMTKEMETDNLTAYPNRRGFCRRTEEILREHPDQEYAILFVNLLHFKAVNEQFDSDTGDRLLRSIPRMLQDSFLKPRLVSRLEGDYFGALVLKKDLDLEQLPGLLHFTFLYDRLEIDMYCRCGIYMVPKGAWQDVQEMLTLAKLAKNSIVNTGMMPYAVYEEQMRDQYMIESEVIRRFENALEQKEFQVYYQPIMDARTEKIAMAEALVRWNLPGRAPISPGSFLPALEENGYITKLDSYVSNSVRQMLTDRLQDEKRIVPVTVNLSRMDLMNDHFLQVVLKQLKEEPALNPYLRYEITESAYTEIREDIWKILNQFGDYGVLLLVDDFGSGVSSYASVIEFDFDIIKLDMEFVRKIGTSPKANAVVTSIIDMAHRIHMQVIAEGVETKAQAEFLKSAGCDYFQGYYYGKPMPKEEFLELLSRE